MPDKPGQPTKYKKEYCDKVLELMKEGASLSEVCLELDVSRTTIYNWRDEHVEFFNTIKRGLELSKGWWEKQGRLGAAGKAEINPTLWFMNMKNRFHNVEPDENITWRDKQEHEHSGHLTIDKILSELD